MEIKEITPEILAQRFKEFGEFMPEQKQALADIQTELNELKGKLLTEDEANAKINSINAELLKINDRLEEKFQKDLEGKNNIERVGRYLSFNPEALKEFSDLIKSKPVGTHKLKLNDAESFTHDSVIGTHSEFVLGFTSDPVLYDKPIKSNFIFDYWDIPVISGKFLFFVEKKYVGAPSDETDIGAAAFIACTADKPQRSFRVEVYQAVSKKIAVYGKYNDCLLEDAPSFKNWIESDIKQNLREVLNDKLYSGNGQTTMIAGLKQGSASFSPTASFTASVPNAGYGDAIIAMMAQMEEAGETPERVHIGVSLYYAILSHKDALGKSDINPLITIDASGQMFAMGVPVHKTNDGTIGNDIVVVGINNGFQIRKTGGSTEVEYSNSNTDDFRKDNTSLRFYERYLTYFPVNRKNSVIIEDADAVILAINDDEFKPFCCGDDDVD